ncbi:CsbD family protein [Streptosporangium sp. NPDC050855]|uniref:CsbD family protein n=1 Tax=Streptosporangium sp. NPDC050855 TaxID=3366194 RepID=UPI00378F1D1E
MGIEDKISHKAEELKGRVKENLGHATGDERLRTEGRADQASGSLKQAGEKVKDAGKKIKDAFGR